MNAHGDTRNPATVGLMVAGLTSLALAVILAIVAVNQVESYYGTDSSAVAALGAWSDALLLVGVVCLVGASVLAGMRWLLRAPASQTDIAATRYRDADGM